MKEKSRGRPRQTRAQPGQPSGQFTAWSSRGQWIQRAADSDVQVDAEKVRADLEQIEKLESRRLELELESQGRTEELVWMQEAQLDKMDSLPVTSSTVWQREVTGRTVTASKTKVQAINLFGYAKLVRETNDTARKAVVGLQRPPGKQVVNPGNVFPDEGMLRRPVADFAQTPRRIPGESAAAFRAYCLYRNGGPKRSLVAARTADRRNSEPRTRTSAGHWPGWSRKYNWVERVKNHDALVEETRLNGQWRRHAVMLQRRLDFEWTNQDRLEAREQKERAVLSRGLQAPTLEVTRIETYRRGKTTYTRKVQVVAPDLAGLAAVSQAYRETMRQAVTGVRHDPQESKRKAKQAARRLARRKFAGTGK